MYHMTMMVIMSVWHIKMWYQEILKRITESPITFPNQGGNLVNHQGQDQRLNCGKFQEKEETKTDSNAK